MKTKLLALDLDGTLLDYRSVLPEETRRTVMAAREAGIEAILVTGRSWKGAKPYYEQLGLTGEAICYLGALRVADGSGWVAYHRPLANESWEAIRQLALAELLPITVCTGADLAVEQGQLPAQNLIAVDAATATCSAPDFTPWKAWNPYTVIDPDLAPCQGAPTMVAVYGEKAVRRTLAAFPKGLPKAQFDLTDRIAGEMVLHIWHEDVDKGRALAAYCRSNGIEPAAVAAMGDAFMDLSMVQWAGIGIAVPDADPALKAAADWIASPVEAIARILRREGT
jgi:hydroxymethylpyrimidine pyrophosphatase-like HAD family hydrolase